MKMVITSRIAKFPFPGMTTTKSKLLLYIAAKMKINLLPSKRIGFERITELNTLISSRMIGVFW